MEDPSTSSLAWNDGYGRQARETVKLQKEALQQQLQATAILALKSEVLVVTAIRKVRGKTSGTAGEMLALVGTTIQA